MRRIATTLHRIAGLFLAGFLILAGLTGSIIAFHTELDRLINPGVFVVERTTDPQPPSVWIQATEEAHPNARVSFVVIPRVEDAPAVLYLAPRTNPATGEPHELKHTQVFVNRGTGEVLASRDRSGMQFDRLHIIPFIYTLHYSLHLGKWGMLIFGIVAIVWFFDCFVGLYLAWPRRAWKAIKQAFTVKWGASAQRVNYDLHRASGLWFWLVLAVLAFSGMSMNLHDVVFEPLLKLISPMTEMPAEALPVREEPESPLAAPLGEAIARSEAGLADAGMEGTLGSIWIDAHKGVYNLGYHTPQDIMHDYAGAWVSVSGDASQVLGVRPPGGVTLGDAIHDWQFPLHSGRAFGLGGRIFIAITGIVVALLSVTGVLIWWRKRQRRKKGKSQEDADLGSDSLSASA